MKEPIHPTYGDLDQLLAVIKRDVKQGYELRLGLNGALHWFSHEYALRRLPVEATEGVPK